jgi:hypothetical protein
MKRSFHAAAAAVIAAFASSAWAQPPGIESRFTRYAGPLTSKLRPNATVYDFPKDWPVRVNAAGNEFAAFEVFIINNGAFGTVHGLDLNVPALTGPGGATIPAQNVTIFRQAYLHTTTPTTDDVPTGWWPDILIPRVDDTQFGQTRCAFFAMSGGTESGSLDEHLDPRSTSACNSSCSSACGADFLVANEFRAFVIQVLVPKDQAVGTYQGSVQICYLDGPNTNCNDVPIPFEIYVRGFNLPATSSLKTAFGMGSTTLAEAEGLPWNSSSDWGNPATDHKVGFYELLYARYMLDHRISTAFVYNMTDWQSPNWATFESQYSAFFDGQDPNLKLAGAKPTTIPYSWTYRPNIYATGSGDAQDQQQHHLWKVEFENKGWLDRTFDYICDEPQHDDVFGATRWNCVYGNNPITVNGAPNYNSWITLQHNAYNAHHPESGFQTLVTTSLHEMQLNDTNWATDATMLATPIPWLWGNHTEPAPVGDTYNHNTRADYTTAGYQDSKVWWYQACDTAGSCVDSGAIGVGAHQRYFPNYVVDSKLPTQNRYQEWLTYRYKMGGVFYYDSTVTFTPNVSTGWPQAWTSVYAHGANGDGTLLYPGLARIIGGSQDIPLPSLRLLMIRAGLQDYEYLYKLGTELGDRAKADAIVDSLFGAGSPPPPFASDKAPINLTAVNIDARRNELANAIEERLGTAAPSFSLQVDPASISRQTNANATPCTVTVTPAPGSTAQQTIYLGTQGVPSFAGASFLSPVVTITNQPGYATMYVNTFADGRGSFILYGDSGTRQAAISVGVESWPAGGGVSVAAGPVAASSPTGASTQASVTVAPGGGFASNASLTATGLPAGATANFASSTIAGGNGATTLTLNAGSAVPGTYNLTITAASTGGSFSTDTTLPWSISDTRQAITSMQLRTNFHDEGVAGTYDSAGHLLVAGHTGGNLGGTNQGLRDIFVSSRDSAGNVLWTTLVGDVGDDLATGIAADGTNSVVVGSTTGSTTQVFSGGQHDGFVAKLDSAGQVVWKRLVGTTGDDVIRGVAIDSAHNIYLAGSTTGPLGGPSGGGLDAWVAKYDASLNLIWARQIGDGGDQIATGVAVDAAGNVFIAGSTTSAIASWATFEGGATDAFMAKFSATGTLIWSTNVGTPGDDVAYALAVGPDGQPVMAGSSTGDLGYVNQGGVDAWVAQRTSTYGSYSWTRLLGSAADEWATGIGIDSGGNVYIAGPVSGPLYDSYQGGQDAFLSKYSPSGSRLWIKQYGGAQDDVPAGVAAGSGVVAVIGTTSGSLGASSVAGKDAFVALFAP